MQSEALPCCFSGLADHDSLRHVACERNVLASALDEFFPLANSPFACLASFGVDPLVPARAALASVLYRILMRVDGPHTFAVIKDHIRAIARSRFA